MTEPFMGIPFVIEAYEIRTLLEFSVAFWTSYGRVVTDISSWVKSVCSAEL
jgi:hypothetical protein